MEPTFKGGKFINRYKIAGTLTTLSPIHIGDGNMIRNPDRFIESDDETPMFGTVMTDAEQRAYIPGSTLKGKLRSWLTQIFCDLSLACPNTSDRAIELKEIVEQIKDEKKTKKQIHDLLRMTEYLFGSAVNEGKLEFWDSLMQTPPQVPENHLGKDYSGYDLGRGTILLKSVAIDPVTGTAAKNKLFNYEVVPSGAQFSLTVAGQNLSKEELGMLLFALDGFNSFIYPVTLGAMGSIGFGRASFDWPQVFLINTDNFKQWLEDALQHGHAGYSNLPILSKSEQDALIEKFKAQFMTYIK